MVCFLVEELVFFVVVFATKIGEAVTELQTLEIAGADRPGNGLFSLTKLLLYQYLQKGRGDATAFSSAKRFLI